MDWNNINRDRDTSGLGPIEYDQTKVPALIRKHADNVRTKTYGQEVREAQARNAELAGLIASEAESKAIDANSLSKDTQNRFNDQIAGTTNSDEVIDARRPTDGVAFSTLNERIEAQVQHVTYAMFGANSDMKYFNPGDGKYYLDKEFTNEYDHNDGIEIKKAHEYANAHGLPIKLGGGHYVIKNYNFIPIKTSVDFGNSVFHMAEDNYSQYAHPFHVYSDYSWQQVESVSDFTVRKGQKTVTQWKKYAGHLLLITDNNRKVAYRNGNPETGQTVRDLVYIGFGGEIIGEITHDYLTSDNKVEVRKVDTIPITIKGGSFLWNGRMGIQSQVTDVEGYGFVVARDRVTIEGQTAGYEQNVLYNEVAHGGGFYVPSKVYDFKLKDISISSRKRVADEYAYAIGGSLVLNYTLENVNGMSDRTYWSSMGSNEITNLVIENCKMRNIDVHYHAWNVRVSGSDVQTFSLVGGGELEVKSTTVRNDRTNSFIAFRADYGASWDGNISIDDCKLIIQSSEAARVALLSFWPPTTDYGYPIVFGHKIRVTNFDFVFTEDSNPSDIRLYDISNGRQYGDHRVVLANRLEMINIDVIGREKGVILFETNNINLAQTTRDNAIYNLSDESGNEVNISPNAKWTFDNVYTTPMVDNTFPELMRYHFSIDQGPTQTWDTKSVVLDLNIKNIKNLHMNVDYAVLEMSIENTNVRLLKAKRRSRIRLSNINIKPLYSVGAGQNAIDVVESDTTFINCRVYPHFNINNQQMLGYSIAYTGLFKVVHSGSTPRVDMLPGLHIGTTVVATALDYVKGNIGNGDISNKLENHLRLSPMSSQSHWTTYQ